MKEIFLTQGKVAFVDDEDFERLNAFKWYASKSRNTFYAKRRAHNDKTRKISIRMHREVVDVPKNLQIDHIDGNGLNNQKSNLRTVTIRQNLQNRHSPKTSKFPGVHWSKSHKKWSAEIRINGKIKCLGHFTDEVEAASAYKTAEAGLLP